MLLIFGWFFVEPSLRFHKKHGDNRLLDDSLDLMETGFMWTAGGQGNQRKERSGSTVSRSVCGIRMALPQV